MSATRKIGTVLASGALMFGLGLVGAPSTLADDVENTSPEVLAEIEAEAWPEYEEGDSDTDVGVAKYVLNDLGYFDGEFNDDYGSELTDAVLDFQNDPEYDLDDTGTLNQETWNTMRSATFGEYGRGTSGPVVYGIQYSLVGDYEKDIAIDGIYGPATETAVEEVQEDFDMAVDGIVGKHTFRAMIAGGV